MIVTYIIGVLIVNSLLLLWFFSPLKTTLGKIMFNKELMPMDFDDLVFAKMPVLGKLIGCYICTSYWLSLLVGLFFMLIAHMPWWWPLLTYFTYPSITYIFYKVISK